MTRKKVKLAFITNDATRKATYKKRKKGLIKKVNELSTLCGVNACAIIYSPYDANPEVWPSNAGAQNVISEFRALPDMDQRKKMVDQETFMNQRIVKATDQLSRQAKDNKEIEMTEVMFQFFKGNTEMFQSMIRNIGIEKALGNLNDLGYTLNQYSKEINRRNEILEISGMEIGESSNAQGTQTATMVHHHDQVGSSSSSLAPLSTFFNPFHQQLHHPMMAPHVGLYDQSQNQQQWGMQMMNNPDHMSYDAEQMGFQFMNDTRRHNHHHDQPSEQYVSGEPSTTAGSSSTVPAVTNPNPTNNLWFR